MRVGVPRLFGSALTLLGAFAIGGVLNAVLVEQSLSPLAPVAVVGTLLGIGLLIAGRRLERKFDPSAYVRGSDDGNGGEEESAELSLSPLDEADLEGRESDESSDGR